MLQQCGQPSLIQGGGGIDDQTLNLRTKKSLPTYNLKFLYGIQH